MLKHGPQVGCRFDTIVIKNVSLVRGLTKGREIPSCIWIHKISTMTSIYVQMVRTQGGFRGEELGKTTKRGKQQYMYRHIK